MKKDIAIIGMAGRFADANNVDELYLNLRNGKDSVKEISPQRIKDTTLPPDEKYRLVGYLDDIDKFDHKFFDISLGEAQTMDPSSRLLLEVVHESFENAGYNPDFFRGTRTGLYVADVMPEYYKLSDEYVMTLISGNSPAFIPPRIARHFDLTGNAVMIDTACSSSSVALHTACNELYLGESEYAIVCGTNLNLFPFYHKSMEFNIWSSDCKSRAFSAEADGMSCGEMVISLLLKPLDQALVNRDHVHAIIKGSAVNNNANRSRSPSAPDSISQSRVIKMAWDKAGVQATDIGYIEAHGSGTQLGDSLEFEGLTQAFREYTDQRHICPLSTMKSNIGHGYSLGGLAGLVRAVLSMKHHEIFPTLHVKNPNPAIDFEHSALYVNKDLSKWEVEPGKTRYAGITSLGASGTNSHIVLEEFSPDKYKKAALEGMDKEAYLVVVSSETESGLARNVQALEDKLSRTSSHSLRDVSFTLIHGRKHYRHKTAIIAKDRNDLLQQLRHLSRRHMNKGVDGRLPKLIFVFSNFDRIPQSLIGELRGAYDVFHDCFMQCEQLTSIRNLQFYNFAFPYAYYTLLRALGVETDHILAVGSGSIVGAVVAEELDLEEGLQQAIHGELEPVDRIDDRITALLDRETAEGIPLFVDIGWGGEIVRQLAARLDAAAGFDIHTLLDEEEASLQILELIRKLYLYGYMPDWNRFAEHYQGYRVELPTYQFEKIRCWLRDTPALHANEMLEGRQVHGEQAAPAKLLIEQCGDMELKIAELWKHELEADQFSVHDNFFDLGGDSLKATRVINQINEALDMRLDFEDLFDFPTIRLLGEYIDSLLGTSEKLAVIWKEVLKMESVAANDNFFELGGHSLIANQILLRIGKQFGVELNFEDFFLHPTLQALSDHIDRQLMQGTRQEKSNWQDIAAVERQEHYAVSPSQKRMWILHQLEEKAVAYNTPFAFLCEGDLRMEALEAAMAAMVERHEILRTVFITVDDEPRQKVLEPTEMNVAVEHVQVSDPHAWQGEVEAIMEADTLQPFDLEIGPLFRMKVIQIEPNNNLIYFNIHHIISDGWSTYVFYNEWVNLYNAYCEGREQPHAPLRIQYKDYAAWFNGLLEEEELQSMKAYWLEQLGGELPVLDLPADKIRPAIQTHHGDKVELLLDEELTDGLQLMCKENDATLFMTLIAALNILFYRYTEQTDMILGSPIAGRIHPELEDQIGFYVNTLALRSRFEPDDTCKQLLEKVKKVTLEAFEHEAYPFDLLVSELHTNRDISRSALFDVLVVLQNTNFNQDHGAALQDVHLQQYESGTTVSQFDMSIEFMQADGGLQCNVEFNTDIFEKARIERMLVHFQQIVAHMLKDMNVQIGHIDLLSSGEKEQLAAWNQTNSTVPVDVCLHQLFEEQVQNDADRLAVLGDNLSMSYGELSSKANKLAAYLRRQGVSRDQAVGICLPRSVDMVVGMLAILKAGGAYVPIAPDYPPYRKAYMVENSGIQIVLANEADVDLGLDRDVAVIHVADAKLWESEESELASVSKPSDLAYILYTSGSTGKPKGVMIEHKSIVNRLIWMQQAYEMGEEDVILHKTTSTFDVSVWEIFLPLISGAKLYLAADGGEKDPEYLYRTISRHPISILHFVPSMLDAFLQSLPRQAAFPELKHCICSGEALTAAHRDLFFEKTGGSVQLHNLYGPTEAAVDVTAYAVQRTDEMIPIGRPIWNTQIHILGPGGKPVPVGVPGELCIAGVQVGRGYIQLPEPTAASFVANPGNREERMYRTGDRAIWRSDGQILYAGRRDDQVKIRGFRIEAGEIEAALLEIETVRGAIVVAREDQNGDQRLIAYLLADEPIEQEAVRSHLLAYLPAYMIPAHCITLDQYPTTMSGKVDRNKLPEWHSATRQDRQQDEPETELEKLLTEIWRQVLGTEQISVHDNFFGIGGDSIKSIQAANRVRERGYDIDTHHIFQYPVLKELALIIEEEWKRKPKVVETISSEWYQSYFRQQFEHGQHHRYHGAVLYSQDKFQADLASTVVEKLVAHHPALQNTVSKYGTVRKCADPRMNIGITEHDLTGTEDARQSVAELAQKLCKHELTVETPLIKVALCKAADAGYAGIFVNSLLVDDASFSIVVQQFADGYSTIQQGKEWMLEEVRKRDTFDEWFTELSRHYAIHPSLEEIDYWQQIGRSFPADRALSSGKPFAKYVKVFEQELAASLLGDANKAYKTQCDDLLLSGLALAMNQWRKQDSLPMMISRSAREALRHSSDTERTVGPFTCYYPAVFQVEEEIGQHIKQVKETVREAPYHGVGYGLLRDSGLLSENGRLHEIFPEITFQATTAYHNEAWNRDIEASQWLLDSAAAAEHAWSAALNFHFVLEEDKLSLQLYYDQESYSEHQVNEMVKIIEEKLSAITKHCLAKEGTEFSPSDFSAKDLDFDDLAKISRIFQ